MLPNKSSKALQGLKGLMALVIMTYHYGHFRDDYARIASISFDLPFINYLKLFYAYGHFCVDTFFLISGFLFFSLSYQKIRKNKLCLYDFMKGKLLKLFPLFLFTTLITGVFQWILLYKTGTTFVHLADLYSLWLNVIGAQHVGLYTLGYNGPAWQISVLLLCYVVSYIYIYISCHAAAHRQGPEDTVTGWKHHTVVMFGIVLISLALYTMNLSAPFLVSWVPRGLLSFFIGGILYYYIYLGEVENCHSQRAKRSCGLAVGIVLFTAVLWRIFTRRGIDIFGNIQLYYILALSPAIVLLTLSFPPVTAVLSVRPVAWLGEISYSIYLWHFPMEVLWATADRVFGAGLDFSAKGMFFTHYAVTLTAAVLSHYFLEPALKRAARRIGGEARRGQAA